MTFLVVLIVILGAMIYLMERQLNVVKDATEITLELIDKELETIRDTQKNRDALLRKYNERLTAVEMNLKYEMYKSEEATNENQ